MRISLIKNNMKTDLLNITRKEFEMIQNLELAPESGGVKWVYEMPNGERGIVHINFAETPEERSLVKK